MITIITGQPNFPDESPVFSDNVVPRVDIFINPDTLQWIYDNVESNIEWHADFVFNNGTLDDTIYDIGFRLRGNTSRYSQKKSFKVSFNTYVSGRKYHGLEKMNLNGEHNDPSIIRSKLGWDLLREFDIPGPRSNHVRVYINNNYYGLYINVEHIDEEFVDSRFGNQDGNLYKCLWPADLDYLGSNPDNYKLIIGDRRVYNLKTNKLQDDYSDLANFIDVLNNTPDEAFLCEMDKIFNINDYLKVIAIDIFTGNWDGYIYNKNNFYLYHNTKTGKFEYIQYDLDNTYGIDWIGRDWGTRDIYDWQQHGDNVRPLYTRIMENQVLRDQFSFYMNELMNEYVDIPEYSQRIDDLRDMIAQYVVNDPYYPLDYGYDYTDFLNSYNQALGGHVAYGLKPYISTRISSTLAQLEMNNIKPVIKYINNSQMVAGEDLWITAFVDDEEPLMQVNIDYSVNDGSPVLEDMFDDGEHNDGEAGDKIYGGAITYIDFGMTIKYTVYAADSFLNISQMPCEPVVLELYPSEFPLLFINEFMAGNDSTIADENGEYDDWIEVYNGDNVPVWLGDKYLTDNFENQGKWQMPDYTMQPGEFVLFWADKDPEQGPFHTNFKLSKIGEEIGLFDSESTGFAVLDSITYGEQQSDISMGRETDGADIWVFFNQPTPGESNIPGAIDEQILLASIKVFPNPVTDGVIYFDRYYNLKLINSFGQIVLEGENVSLLDVSRFGKGIYIIITDEGLTAKVVIR